MGEDNLFSLSSYNANNGLSNQSMGPNYMQNFGQYGASASIPTDSFGMSMPAMDMNTAYAPAASGGGFMGGMLGSTAADGTKTAGWGGMALGAVQGLGNMYMGMKQFGLAKKQLQQGKDQFNMNYAAQRTNTNNAINDRNVARTASRQGASSPYKPLELVA